MYIAGLHCEHGGYSKYEGFGVVVCKNVFTIVFSLENKCICVII